MFNVTFVIVVTVDAVRSLVARTVREWSRRGAHTLRYVPSSTYPACKNLMTSPLAGLWVATLLAAPAASTAVIVAAVALLLSAVALLLSAVALAHGILLQASEDCALRGVAIQADLVAVLQGFALALVQRVPRTTLRGTPQRRSSAVRASSHGRGPTLWRSAQGGPWNPLYKGESKALQNGDQISLDCNAPESAILACLQENAMGQGYGAQQQGYGAQQQGYGGDNYGGGGGWGGQQGGYPQPGQW